MAGPGALARPGRRAAATSGTSPDCSAATSPGSTRCSPDQVNAILHHPRFQKLEASWRGLRYLVDQIEEADNVKIRVLSVSWKELARDLERAIEFDQSQLFRKVYSDEFGTPGGEPFGVLLGDYEIRPRPSPEHPIDDVGDAAGDFARGGGGVRPVHRRRRIRRCSAWTISPTWNSR